MRKPIALTAALTAFTILGLMPADAEATEETAENEQIECQVCHADTEQSAEILTDRGTYFQLMESLTGYEQVIERFERCTYCHSATAGDTTLTREGQRFRWMMEDMVGLRAWLDENHPQPADEGPAEG